MNFFWWLERTIPFWLGLNLIGVGAVLVLRRWFDVGMGLGIAYFGLVLAISFFGLSRSRSKFIGINQGISRLDRVFEMRGALCAASQGVIDWPSRVDRDARYFNVALGRIHVTFGLSFFLLATGLYWPISKKAEDGQIDFAQGPQAWAKMEEWLNAMEASELLEDESLDRFEEKLDTLENQEREDWYSDGSLEATDFLMSQSEEATLQFLESLDLAMQSAARLSSASIDRMEEGDRRQLGKALEELDFGSLALREDLMKALSELSNSDGNSAGREAIEQMLERMREGAETARKGLGIPHREWEPMSAGMGKSGGEDGSSPAPLTLSAQSSPEIEGTLEGVSNDDRARSLLGDTMFTSEVNIDGYEPGHNGTEAGNRTLNTGDGGSAVWKTRARPKEQALLKRYFSDE